MYILKNSISKYEILRELFRLILVSIYIVKIILNDLFRNVTLYTILRISNV